MFNDTWRWAGEFRCSNKNIGGGFHLVWSQLTDWLSDVQFQIIHQSYPTVDEISYRFHHRLVSIHPFPNGNGRHARLMTDILLVEAGVSPFSWGGHRLEAAGPVRKQYIAALKKADTHDYSALAAFVRAN